MLKLPDAMRIHFPTPIDFGAGTRKKLGSLLKENGCSRPLIVCDRGIAKLKLVGEMEVFLKDEGINPTVFSDMAGNPVKSFVVAGVQAYRQGECDSVVGLGGGAPLDVAKVIAVMVHHPGDVFDYEDGKPDALPVDKEMPFLVALPTTAGTGSEVGRSSVISDEDSKVKKIIFSPRMLPNHVLVDPELVLQLPAKITAATGMDALSHLVEAFLAKGFHPMCDGIALEGMRLVHDNLKECVDFATIGDELDAEGEASLAAHVSVRGQMLMAAIMGAVAFQKGLGVTHSCAHALSTVCDMHHGLANAIMMPYCMNFNEAEFPEKFRRMELSMGIPEGGFQKWLCDLRSEIGIPNTLSAAGVSADDLEQLVECALADPCHTSNIRTVTQADFEGLFEVAL